MACRFASCMGVMLICAVAPAFAAVSASHPCAEIADPGRRLACYDQAYPPSEAVVQEQQEAAVGQFGLDAPRPKQAPAVAPEQLEGTVARVVYQSGGDREVTLDNGQVWRITDAGSRGIVAGGDAVRVRKAALGSYMLITTAGVPLRARRVR